MRFCARKIYFRVEIFEKCANCIEKTSKKVYNNSV